MGSLSCMQGAPSACSSSRCLQASVASVGVVLGFCRAAVRVIVISVTPCTMHQIPGHKSPKEQDETPLCALHSPVLDLCFASFFITMHFDDMQG